MNNTSQSVISYYPAIDGLRALSFFVVFLFHVPIQYSNLGWGGVNVFFVISGFLITEILLKTKGSSTYYVKFYFRRSLRIFPIYYFMVIVILFYYYFKFYSFPAATLPLLTYSINYFYSFLSDSYVDALHHTWTLAIEEQFYLIWPLLIALIPTRYYFKSFFFLIVFAIIYRTLSVPFDALNFIQLPAQIDSLLLGAVIAVGRYNNAINSQNAKKMRNLTLIIGFVGLFFVFLGMSLENNLTIFYTYIKFGSGVDYQNSYIGIHTFFFIAVLSMGLVLTCLYDNNIFVKVLRFPLLVHLGKISYGLYLYHYPILYLVRFLFKGDKIWTFSIGLTLTIIASEISYFTFEKYFRLLKDKITFT